MAFYPPAIAHRMRLKHIIGEISGLNGAITIFLTIYSYMIWRNVLFFCAINNTISYCIRNTVRQKSCSEFKASAAPMKRSFHC